MRPERHRLDEPVAHQRREIRHIEPPVLGSGHRRQTEGEGLFRAIGPRGSLITERVGEKRREIDLLGLVGEPVPGGEPLPGAACLQEPRPRILDRHQVGLDLLGERSRERTKKIGLEQRGPQVARRLRVGQERSERRERQESRYLGEAHRRTHHAVHACRVRNRVHVAQHPGGARLALCRLQRRVQVMGPLEQSHRGIDRERDEADACGIEDPRRDGRRPRRAGERGALRDRRRKSRAAQRERGESHRRRGDGADGPVELGGELARACPHKLIEALARPASEPPSGGVARERIAKRTAVGARAAEQRPHRRARWARHHEVQRELESARAREGTRAHQCIGGHGGVSHHHRRRIQRPRPGKGTPEGPQNRASEGLRGVDQHEPVPGRNPEGSGRRGGDAEARAQIAEAPFVRDHDDAQRILASRAPGLRKGRAKRDA